MDAASPWLLPNASHKLDQQLTKRSNPKTLTHRTRSYQWDVWLSNFDPSSPIAADMDAVARRCAVSTVQLRLTFMRGLHPFFPPRLEVRLGF